MARLLVQAEWYSTIDAPDVYETEFERVVFSRSEMLFPGFTAVPFKSIVSSEVGSARADYALIESGYRSWWVVEVELSTHSLHGHVIPQVSVLATARYGVDEARLLAARASGLEEGRLVSLMKGLPPRVLVVVERPMPDWDFILRRYGIRLAVFEIFRSDRDRFCFRVDGYVPSAPAAALTDCWIDPGLVALVRIASPGALLASGESELQIEFEARVTEWDVLSSASAVWLVARSRNPLRRGARYEISRRADGALAIRELLDVPIFGY